MWQNRQLAEAANGGYLRCQVLQVTGEAVVLSDIQLLPCGVIRSSFEAFQQHRANRSAVDIWQVSWIVRQFVPREVPVRADQH